MSNRQNCPIGQPSTKKLFFGPSQFRPCLGFVARSKLIRLQKTLFWGWLTYKIILPVVSCQIKFWRFPGSKQVRFRALRYYRIGIKNPILLFKSIVSVSYRYRNSRFQKVSVQYQYQNSLKRKYHINISIEFSTFWYHAQYQLLQRSKLHLSS